MQAGEEARDEDRDVEQPQELGREPWGPRVAAGCRATWRLWMRLPLWVQLYLLIFPAFVVTSGIMIAVVDSSLESTATWVVSSALVTSVTVEGFCFRRWRCDQPPTNYLYRVAFGISNYSVPGFLLKPDEVGTAYWGTSREFELQQHEALDVAAMFQSGERYPIWVHPKDPTRVSTTGNAAESDDILYIFCIVLTTVLGVLYFSSICFAVRYVRRSIADEHDAAIELSENAMTQKINQSRRKRVVDALQQVCVVSANDRETAIHSRHHVDCSICLESFVDDEENAQELMQLPCSHLYHSECIVNWVMLGRHKTCPLCHAHLRVVVHMAEGRGALDPASTVGHTTSNPDLVSESDPEEGQTR
ncbi:E3 ubiquitin-protein ligase ATL9 [Porphyridium purpureum]|uniref:E3 ubiquitin-protein ligase ATL9 n=1 Tax=Porphyridium purpureum TaxID=35688 RepID=A0A5J4Z2Y6_PORPP|nr:E3 ubiquitin-protein ligase ATL9 [Porphyridium purpureum]|eukprot:POR8905..scf295_1